MIKGKNTGLKIEDCDLFIAMDSGDSKRLGKYEDVFLSHKNTLAIDHHETHEKYACLTVVEDISSTCELVVRFAKELGVIANTIIETQGRKKPDFAEYQEIRADKSHQEENNNGKKL